MDIRRLSVDRCQTMISNISTRTFLREEQTDKELQRIQEKILAGVAGMLSRLHAKAASSSTIPRRTEISVLLYVFLREFLLDKAPRFADQQASDKTAFPNLLHWAMIVSPSVISSQEVEHILDRYPSFSSEWCHTSAKYGQVYEISPLHLLCLSPDPEMEIAKLLIDANPRALLSTHACPSPLCLAALFCRSIEFARFLLEETSKANTTDVKSTLSANGWRGCVPLHFAACSQRISEEIFDLILDLCPEAAFISVKPTQREYALQHAAATTHCSLHKLQRLWAIADSASADPTKNMHEIDSLQLFLNGSRFTELVSAESIAEAMDTLRWLVMKAADHPSFLQHPARIANIVLMSAVGNPDTDSELLMIIFNGLVRRYNLPYTDEFMPLHHLLGEEGSCLDGRIEYSLSLVQYFPDALSIEDSDGHTPLALICVYDRIADLSLATALKIIETVLLVCPGSANIRCAYCSFVPIVGLPVQTFVQSSIEYIEQMLLSDDPADRQGQQEVEVLQRILALLPMLRAATTFMENVPVNISVFLTDSDVRAADCQDLWDAVCRVICRLFVGGTLVDAEKEAGEEEDMKEDEDRESEWVIDGAMEDLRVHRLRDLNFKARKGVFLLRELLGVKYGESGVVLREIASYL